MTPFSRRHSRSSESGQTAVEFALVLPILAVLLIAIVEFGVVFHDYVTVTDASRVAAREAAVSRHTGDFGAAAEAAGAEAAESLNDDLVVDCAAEDWTRPGTDVSCTVTYPYSIDVLGWVVASGDLTSETTERLE
jgi:Flp pilus assembly protein TadG